MLNQTQVPRAKYKLLNNIQEKRWRFLPIQLSLIFTITGIILIISGWINILTLNKYSEFNFASKSFIRKDATIVTWSCRARMYAESSEKNQNADRNSSIHASTLSPNTSSSKIIVCYYTIPRSMNSSWELSPAHIDPNICTHIIVGFASVVNCSISLGSAEIILQHIMKLKVRQPKLKVMVSTIGMNELHYDFLKMVKTHSNRKIFIKSVLNLTKLYNLDGLDIDWEFPAWLNANNRQRIWFIQLLQEIKKAFDRSGRELILSAAVAAPVAIVDESYEVPQLAMHVDFVNLMAYDYHSYVWYFPLTGLNAPLYGQTSESGYTTTLNVNYSAMYWVSKGMPKDKLVIGIPTYGHSFKLDNVENTGIGAPAKGYGRLGIEGFTDYYTICKFISLGANKIFDEDSKTPYCYKDDEWISFDDINSVTEKAQWIKANDYRGAMIFSLNTDDWNATCNTNSTFPLTRIIAENIIGS